jgi:hypothetical protein
MTYSSADTTVDDDDDIETESEAKEEEKKYIYIDYFLFIPLPSKVLIQRTVLIFSKKKTKHICYRYHR